MLNFILFSFNSFAQLSQGGKPIAINNLKSSLLDQKVEIMPHFNIQQEIIDAQAVATDKSCRFAYGFNVNYTTKNSGSWYFLDNCKVWQLKIKSEYARSIGLIFSDFHIPNNARLFVFNENADVVLGAFTSANNKPHRKFAVFPVPGDLITIQYEEPYGVEFEGVLELEKINHDFLGVYKNRWDKRSSGICNVDINCDFNHGLQYQQRSVVRILADDELGTGTLLNNTAQNGKPYLISAFHIYDNAETANISLYDFNYESPFCTKLDGSDLQTISGSSAIAWFDSLDFMLVELSEMPPAMYRPYYSGWSIQNITPANSYTIHHPNGDVKKISHDTGRCDSLSYTSSFLKFGHWKVLNWETGTTEGGSSGAALFDNNKRVVGTLSGGYASCSNISYDAFSRFNKMWSYRKEYNKQLKIWLDPMNSGQTMLNGYDPYLDLKQNCEIATNFFYEDTPVTLSNSIREYYTGTNNLGITEIAESFNSVLFGTLSGVSIGIAKCKFENVNDEITIRVYSGENYPQFAEKQYKYPVKHLTNNAMNYIPFEIPVNVQGKFFISIVLPQNIDSLLIYQSQIRSVANSSTLLFLKDSKWLTVPEVFEKTGAASSLLLQAHVCSASFVQNIDSTSENSNLFKAYPNPVDDYLIVELKERLQNFELMVTDMCGRTIYQQKFSNSRFAEIQLPILNPGIYLIIVVLDNKRLTKRFIKY